MGVGSDSFGAHWLFSGFKFSVPNSYQLWLGIQSCLLPSCPHCVHGRWWEPACCRTAEHSSNRVLCKQHLIVAENGNKTAECKLAGALSTRKLLLQSLSVREEVSICRAAVELRRSPNQDTQAGSIAGSFVPCSKRDGPKVNEECQLMTVSRHCKQ